MQTLQRTAFLTSRTLEFFTEKELSMQIGHNKTSWPISLVKELIDNALDACETAGIPPQIQITAEADSVSVRDNGPGLPIKILEQSLDYLVRVSDKNHYVSPSRGQLGNALKTVWAAPFVADGNQGRAKVITGGKTHTIDVMVDRIAQAPVLEHTIGPDGLVKNGTLVQMLWPGVAGYLDGTKMPYSYNTPPTISQLISYYSLFNPHAGFTFADSDSNEHYEATDPTWRKWTPNQPTSPHWYISEQLRSLIAAYVSSEQNGNEAKTVRAFVSEFAGLSGTAKQKVVTEAAGLSGAYLHDLINGNDINRESAKRLLAAMQAESRPIKPTGLGIIGIEHITHWLSYYCEPASVRYKKIDGCAGQLPFVLEVALAYFAANNNDIGRVVITGLNWTPTLSIPFNELSELLAKYRLDSQDPVSVVIHLSCPRLDFIDRGKSRLNLPDEISEALDAGFKSIATDHLKAKRQADREDKLRQSQLAQLRKGKELWVLTTKEAAYRVMERAYMKASDNNRLPANARQIMYAARPMVLELTEGKCWKNSSQFTQHLLPDFIEQYPALAAGWDVVYDARGKLVEPHTKNRIDLGTLAVRRYVADWTGRNDNLSFSGDYSLNHRVETSGPVNRFKYALFIEKEGFNELLDSVKLADSYDLAIMSTKGMSVTAARQLVADLSSQDVTIFVLHDFDKAGLSIVNTLKNDTRRWQYKTPPNVIDLGLRLADVKEMGLQSEPVEYKSKVNPHYNLRDSGATKEECNFLVSCGYSGNWRGERVELNAMTSGEFITWLKSKLDSFGVTKFVPDSDILESAYRRAKQLAEIQRAIDDTIANFGKNEIDVPADLAEQVNTRLEKEKAGAWDDIIFDLAENEPV